MYFNSIIQVEKLHPTDRALNAVDGVSFEVNGEKTLKRAGLNGPAISSWAG